MNQEDACISDTNREELRRFAKFRRSVREQTRRRSAFVFQG